MKFEDLLKHADRCPLCLDISYTDADGVEHEIFDLCEIHKPTAVMNEVCRTSTDTLDKAA